MNGSYRNGNIEVDGYAKAVTLDVTAEKIEGAKRKLEILRDQGKGRRSEDYKYWFGQLKVWQAHHNLLSELTCPRHHNQAIIFGKIIQANGEVHVPACCGICMQNVYRGPWVPKGSLPEEIFTEIPITEDYRLNNPPCEVCKAIGTELHHWAPKELFPETYEHWPKAYLCTLHHREWHAKITIPYRKLRNKEATQ